MKSGKSKEKLKKIKKIRKNKDYKMICKDKGKILNLMKN